MADIDLALQHSQLLEIQELNARANQLLRIVRIDRFLTHDFGQRLIMRSEICEALGIPLRAFSVPDEVLAEAVAQYRALGASAEHIRTQLQKQSHLLPAYRDAVARQLRILSDDPT